ncbi:MAG TPA: nuclear transport factor 2 family protein, partial [Acidimicrobiales bacterium]|nr:nuclear transport factor 2 family protein [Acidimicrobiales bacterium]
WLEGMKGPKAFPVSMHMLGDPLIDLPEGGDHGTLDTYAVVYQLGDQAQEQGDLTLGMRYVDRVARYGDGWVIKDRTVTTLWMR